MHNIMHYIMKKWPLQISPWTKQYLIIEQLGKTSLLPSGPNFPSLLTLDKFMPEFPEQGTKLYAILLLDKVQIDTH